MKKKLVNESLGDILKPKPFDEGFNELFDTLYSNVMKGELTGLNKNYLYGSTSYEIINAKDELLFDHYFDEVSGKYGHGMYVMAHFNVIPFKNIYNSRLISDTYRGMAVKYEVPKKAIKIFIKMLMDKMFKKEMSRFYIKYT